MLDYHDLYPYLSSVYRPGGFILNVWNLRVRLFHVTESRRGQTYRDALSPAAYERGEVEGWLESALDATGGHINISGHYPLVVPIPEWLEPEIAMAILGE